MLNRPVSQGVVVISQPAHAWVSGQLARCWGNEQFGHFAPAEEVCLATEQHDLGFLPWEQAPTLNRKTGLPHTFMDMPTDAHLDIWSRGIQQMLDYGRYPALLVSLHFTRLCQRHSSFNDPAEAQMKQNFLDTQSAFQSMLLASLRSDPAYAACSTDEAIGRNRQLIAVWDWMSLLVTMGFSGEQQLTDVPMANGVGELKMAGAGPGESRITVAPWPFHCATVKLVCEGRLLPHTYTQQRKMRLALKEAAPVTVRVELAPG